MGEKIVEIIDALSTYRKLQQSLLASPDIIVKDQRTKGLLNEARDAAYEVVGNIQADEFFDCEEEISQIKDPLLTGLFNRRIEDFRKKTQNSQESQQQDLENPSMDLEDLEFRG